MPGVEIETVTLDEDIDHPLDAVLARVDRSKAGPVMILGLERSNPSSAKERPILYALNMSRPEWPKELPRPLVFWVPEYLLGLMGREAPDFLDWRSDTLFFPESAGEDFVPLVSDIWRSGWNQSMPEPQRRRRIEELRARLAGLTETDDPVILAARAGWALELGNHLYRLSERSAAREIFLLALEIERRLGRTEQIADILGNLGAVDEISGLRSDAEEEFMAALKIHEASGNNRGQINALANLANLYLHSGGLELAMERSEEALGLAEAAEIRDVLPTLYTLQLNILLLGGDTQAAREVAEKAISATETTGSPLRHAELLHALGVLSSLEGDWEKAEQHYQQALDIARRLGDRQGAAESAFNLGLLNLKRERVIAARVALTEAEQLFRAIGDLAGVEKTEVLLGELGGPSSP